MKKFVITAAGLLFAAGFATALLLHHKKDDTCTCGNCGENPDECGYNCTECGENPITGDHVDEPTEEVDVNTAPEEEEYTDYSMDDGAI